MAESVKQRINSSIEPGQKQYHLYQMIESLRIDLAALQTQLNTHVHSGVTAGGANTAAPTTTLATLNTQP
jgi:hypothetical protein